ncbi:MAG: enoyl-CoA hydratase/isomerase family protein [Candidatus Acidiferrales bacterium]
MDSTLRSVTLGNIHLFQLENIDGFPRLTRSLLTEFHQQLDSIFTARIETSTAIRGVVITGTAQAFAAGADINEINSLTAAQARHFSALGQSLMNKIERSPIPIVAAIRGYCFGGALDLALACHTRIAADDASFAHPGGRIGIITGWGGTARLPRLIGRSRAMEMLSTARRVSAAEAFSVGLVRRIVAAEAVLPTAFEFAQSRRALAP